MVGVVHAPRCKSLYRGNLLLSTCVGCSNSKGIASNLSLESGPVQAGQKHIYIRSSSSNSSPRLLAKYTLLLSYTPKYSPAPTSVQTPRKAPPLNSPFTPDSAMISLAILSSNLDEGSVWVSWKKGKGERTGNREKQRRHHPRRR